MKKLISVFMAIAFLGSFAAADFHTDIEGDLEEHIGTELPSPASFLFANEKLNIYYEEEFLLSAVTEEGVLKSVSSEMMEDPTLIVIVHQGAVDRITASEEPLKALKVAFKEREISYEAQSALGKIKYNILGFFSRLFL